MMSKSDGTLGNGSVLDVSGNIELNSEETSSATVNFLGLSSFGSKMQLPAGIQFSSPSAREWFTTRRQNLKPWLTFLSTSRFKAPQTPQKLSVRLVKNVEYFQSNYMFVFIGLIIYCLITSPLLLVAVAASLGGCYVVSLKNIEKKLTIAGHEFSLAQQYAAIGILSMPIFYLAGATSVIFWVIGASFFLIMLHATFYDIESITGSDDQPFEDLQMEEV